MVTTDPDLMHIDEAVAHIMRVEHCSRRRARRILVKALAAGEVRATGERTDTGERVEISTDYWDEALKRVPDEH